MNIIEITQDSLMALHGNFQDEVVRLGYRLSISKIVFYGGPCEIHLYGLPFWDQVAEYFTHK